MSGTSQEVVLEGWLTKSPPTKRIWRARWRRRWFSLQNSGELPGQYFLMYYTDRKCRKLKGTINLDQCEQVDTGLKFEDNKYKFDFMFDIKTPTRTYYLAAENEEEMKTWANCICDICGLKATTDDDTVTKSLNLSSSTNENQQNVHLNTGDNKDESPTRTPISSGPYIPISECITGHLPSQGVQDFYDLLQYNIKNSYYRSHCLKAHNNETYDSTSPTYLNDINSETDPRFYDFPRQLQPSGGLQKNLKSSETYTNLPQVNKKAGNSPLQSPTDSESVFTDDDFVQECVGKSVNHINSGISKISLDDLPNATNPPPRPPKRASSSSLTLNYLNLSQVPKPKSKDVDFKEIEETNNPKQAVNDEMYDFPRSHQLENENLCNSLYRRHCYNNAAPVKIEGEIFRYDIKLNSSSNEVSQVENTDIQEEPSSPTSVTYSNLSSPVLLSDSPSMLPPQIYRSLKPKRKLSDSLSITSSNEPSSPRPAPSVDRSCKPSKAQAVRKAVDIDVNDNRKIKPSLSPIHLHDGVYGNQQMFNERQGGSDLSRVQYLDLDHSPSQFSTTPTKIQPLRSPGASTVYKKVDFKKTEAFNITRQHLERQRKEPIITYKK